MISPGGLPANLIFLTDKISPSYCLNNSYDKICLFGFFLKLFDLYSRKISRSYDIFSFLFYKSVIFTAC